MKSLSRLISDWLRIDVLKSARHRLFMHCPKILPRPRPLTGTKKKVLLIGIYLGDKVNTVDHLYAAFQSDAGIAVEQRWAALGKISTNPSVRAVTRFTVTVPESKYILLNRLMQPGDFDRFDYIVVTDDDLYIRPNFLSQLISHQVFYGFACAQAARAWHSHFDLTFVLRRPWLKARQTRFVEAGPLVSMRIDAARMLLPFDDRTPLWGVDLTWYPVLEKHGLTMGIIDALSMDHSLRPQGHEYKRAQEQTSMEEFLRSREHLSMEHAFTTIKTFRWL